MSPFGGKQQVDNWVKDFREKAGFTQEKLAAMANLSRQSIIAIEKGRFTPSVLTALHLADALGARVDELFQIKEESGNED